MNIRVYTVHIMNNKHKEDTVTLEILQVIENKKDVTQRHLAGRLDVALGLANSYLKRCVHKGLVKISQAPANRYFYYLTPKGFAEKSRLTTEYLSSSFDFYRKASNSLNQIFTECKNNDKKNIVFCGISELTEIAFFRSHDFQVSITGILDLNTEKTSFLHLPVSNNLSELGNFDVCIVTSLEDANHYFNYLVENIEKEKIMMPSILGFRDKQTSQDD